MTSYTSKYQSAFYVSLLVIVLVLTALIFKSLIMVLILASIVAIIVNPAHKWILKYVKSPSLSSFVTMLGLVILVGVPVYLLTNQIVKESQSLYLKLSANEQIALITPEGLDGLNPYDVNENDEIFSNMSLTSTTDKATQKIESTVQRFLPDFKLDTTKYLVAFSSWVTDRLGGVVSGTIDLTLKFVLFLIALFYIIRDGSIFRKAIKLISPFAESKENKIEKAMVSSVRSVMLGSFAVALIQGILSSIGFMIFGVPNAILWGTVAGIAALIPSLGTGIVSAPIVLYLYFYSEAFGGFAWAGQLIWAVVFVGLVDNFIAPYVINKGINIHPLIILFSILGGLQFFGPEGFILGPLIISILFALMRLYEEDYAQDNGKE
jgi:predicted PurR-regulated permease PerM